MESLYTTSVSNVPADYNNPSAAYKKHVWIAVAGIVAFFAFYLFLTIWFFNSAYRLLADAFGGGNSSLMTIGVGVASLFLGIFMVKAFFFVQTKYDVKDREVKPADEPVLFDYLHKCADEIGAPRPNKVYLSNRVNAAVFYDLSFLNLFFPSKKNLEIGLGLINVLNLGEFKAVLAHEYGHFAQRSMLVGRWVYIANQIANTIITKRDALDALLSGLSRIDIRIAWIGWILSIIVWSIRSLIELIFRVVVMSQRALSREMEFQADLVSVSVTGSDALIHALHKLQAADAALSDAMSSLGEQLGKGKALEDLYAIQSNSIEKTAYILDDDDYGKTPKLPDGDPAQHRVFSDKIAQPPKMWLTHPPDQEREENAKRNYIAGHIDDRSAWVLFNNPENLRRQLTQDLVASTKVKAETMSTTEALSFHNKQFERSYFSPTYRGVYLKRFFTEEYENSSDMYISELRLADSTKMMSELYPESIVEDLEDFTSLHEEMVQLEAIKDKRLTASGEGGIWHRGTQIRRKELPAVIAEVKTEVDAARARVTEHDRRVRTVHLRLAEEIGKAWDDYLEGLLSIIHYCEHNIINIQDAQRNLGHVLRVVMADNKVSSSEMSILIRECNSVHGALADVVRDQVKITLDKLLIEELKQEDPLFEEFQLPPANEQNIQAWVNNIDGWTGTYIQSLTRLRSEALELLLRTEEQVKNMYQSQQIKQAPSPSRINTSYTIMLPGSERENSIKLSMWDKFISADGIVPALTKFAVSTSIVGATVFMAGQTGVSDLTIYNGLGQSVLVDLNGKEIEIAANAHKKTDFKNSEDYEITTRTLAGETIETFAPSLSNTSSHYIYNVAQAGVLAEFRVYYGREGGHQNLLGDTRWLTTKADYIFEEAPEQLSSRSGSATKDVLMGFSDITALNIFSMKEEDPRETEFIKSHVLWDPSAATHLVQWLSVASEREDAISLLQQRLKTFPDEVYTLRVLMDAASETERTSLCEEYAKKSVAEPSNANIHYIATRCLADGPEQDNQFLEGARKWPTHGWMNYAASYVYANRNNWEKTHEALHAAYDEGESLKPVIGLHAERVSRLLKAEGKEITNTRNLESSYLENYKLMESGTDEDPYTKVYYLINTGALQEAMDLAAKTPNLKKNITAICAASDGAKQEWINKALQFSPDSLSELGILSVTGLRLKMNLDISNFQEKLEEIVGKQDFSITNFIKNIKAGNYNGAKVEMDNSVISTKGQLCVLAYIANGNRIPSDWKLKAQALLFASEKPFIAGGE